MKSMNRRKVILGATACAAALAGCTSSDSGGGSTETATTTEAPTQTEATTTETPTQTATTTLEPASFEVVETTEGTYELGPDWPLEFTVANRGEQSGEFTATLQVSATGSDWSDVSEISLQVPAGETETYSQQIGSIDTAGTAYFRLTGTDARWSITFTNPESEFQGPDSEGSTYVELQYRDYHDHGIDEIKENAENPSYENLYRNADSMFGDPVHYTGTIVQEIPYETHYVYFIALNNDSDQPVYASWVGDRYIKGDEIEFWGQVLGIEVYETGSGSTNTVPALAIADIELLN